MDIIVEPITIYERKLGPACCGIMRDALSDKVVYLSDGGDVVYLLMGAGGKKLNFCPFCGDPIRITYKEEGDKTKP